MKLKLLSLMGAALVLMGCGEPVSKNADPRILTMGDSLLASHGVSNNAISDAIEAELGEPVIDRSVMGARMLYKLPISGSMGLNISKQYRPGKWDWVVLNGGGNDLWLGCGCILCNGKLRKLVSEDGRAGHIPKLIQNLRRSGAKVIYVGYLRSPGVGSPIEHCRDEGNELEARIAAHADLDSGVHFLSLADLVPPGDRTFHSVDMIHPSKKASSIIGGRIAQIIKGQTGS